MEFVELNSNDLYMIEGGKKNYLKIVGGAIIVVGGVAGCATGDVLGGAVCIASGVGCIIDGWD